MEALLQNVESSPATLLKSDSTASTTEEWFSSNSEISRNAHGKHL